MITRLRKLCDKYEYVSFDIFDTLIKRLTVQPKDVFELVEKIFENRNCSKSCIKNFSIVRVESERIARKNNLNSEITLNDIYDVIKIDYDHNLCEIYKSIEIEIEERVCVSSPVGKEIYDYCINSGKTIFITSDMYLPKDVIEQILRSNGYTNYKSLYLSCDKRKTKCLGSLYDALLEYENLLPKDLLHIGDNFKSDFIVPLKKGIKSYLFRPYSLLRTIHRFDNSCDNSLLRFIRFTNPYDEIFSKIGYCDFGPLLYGFISWIIFQAEEKKHEKIFFLSRDGYLMKKVYEKICSYTSPKASYFYASRRALQVASIHLNPDFNYVMSHMFVPKKVTIRWLMKRWGLEPELFKNDIKFNLDDEVSGSNILENTNIEALYNQLKHKIVENSKKEYRAFGEYLDLQDFSGNVAIVDIGWFGNMQSALQTMLNHLNKKVEVTGYYLGVVPNSRFQKTNKMMGYLFEKEKNEELYLNLKYTLSLMELFFMAPHGSAERYTKRESGIIVELSDFEFKNSYTFDQIQKLQESALMFVTNYKNRQVESFKELEYLSGLYRKITNPNLVTATTLGNLQIWDEKYMAIAPQYSLYKWLIHPKLAIKHFVNASWKNGFLKRNLVLPLPYGNIIFLLRTFIIHFTKFVRRY